MEYIPSTNGTFNVVVDSSMVEGTGGYRLFYLKVPGSFTIPSGDDGGALVSGNNDGSTSLGDLDVWTFDANTGDRVTLNLSERSGGTTYSPRARVFDSNGQLVAYVNDPNSSGSSSNSVMVIVPTNGTFSVVIDSSLASGSGTYRLNYLLEMGPFTYPPATGTSLSNGENAEGNLGSDEEDRWTFDASAGDSCLLRLGKLSSSGSYPALRLRVYDPNGDLVADDTYSYADDVEVALTAAVTGKHTAVVSFNQGVTGTYRLHYLKVPGTFTVPSGDDGGAFANGGNYDGTIDIGDIDAWTFDASAGDSCLLRVGRLTSSGSYPAVRVRVYDPNGALVANETYSYADDVEVALTATLTGTHTVVVSFSESVTGTYRLHYLNIPGTFTIPGGDDGGTFANGGNYDGAIDIGDIDAWTFDASAGDSCLVRIGRLTSSGSYPAVRVRVYDPNGALVANETYSYADDVEIALTAVVSGVHTVVVSLNEGVTGTYRLHYLKMPGTFAVPGGDEGGALGNGGNYDGTIDIGDIDAWTFDASVGDSCLLRIGRLTSSGSYPAVRVRVYDPNGALVANETYSYADDVEIALTATVSGAHTVVVSLNEGVTGTYRLHYLKLPGAFTVPGGDEGGALGNGGNYDGTIDIGDIDAWTFDASAGDSCLVRVGRLTSSGSYPALRLRVYDPNGALVANETYSYADDVEIALTAMVSGAHTVVVSLNEGVTGTYRLHYLKLPGTFTVPGGDEGGSLAIDTSVVYRKWLDILSALFPLFPLGPTWFYSFQLLACPLNFSHYLFNCRGPCERSGCLVPRLQELFNSFL